MKKQYKNPPIEEAIVEFHFVPGHGSEWDLIIPGKLHEHPDIKTQYPSEPRVQKLFIPTIQSMPGQPSSPTVQIAQRVQFLNDDGSRLVSVGPNVLSVNVLRPYDGWEQFRSRIEKALHAYTEVAQPIGVKRVGVRYLNKIVVPERDITIKKYTQYILAAGNGLPVQVEGFWNRVIYKYNPFLTLVLNQLKIEAPEGQSAFGLDLDVSWEGAEAKSLDEIIEVVNDLHEREGAAFEAIITDATRELFDGE